MTNWGITFSQKGYFVYGIFILLLVPLFFHTLRLQKRFRIEWKFPLKPKFRIFKGILYFVGIAFLWLSLIGPQWGQKETVLNAQGLDLCFALDLSQSMLAEDVPPSRLKMVKNQLSIFLPRLGGDKIAIVGFAGSSFIASPLTPDKTAAMGFLEPLDPSFVSNPTTRLNAGIEGCFKALGISDLTELDDFEGGASKLIAIISDGEDPDSDSSAIDKAIELEIPVMTLAVGTDKGASIPLRNERGEVSGFLKEPKSGKPVVTKINIKGLKDISEKTKGSFFNLNDGMSAWDDFETALNNFTRESQYSASQKAREERYQWPLGIAFAVLFFDFILPEMGFKLLSFFIMSILFCGATLPSQSWAQTIWPETVFLNRKAYDAFIRQESRDVQKHLSKAIQNEPSSLLTQTNFLSFSLLETLNIESKDAQKESLKQLIKLCDKVTQPLFSNSVSLSQIGETDQKVLKVFLYQCGLVFEFAQDQQKALVFHYENTFSLGIFTEVEKKSQKAIERLLQQSQNKNSKGSGEGQGQNSDSENEPNGKNKNSNYDPGKSTKPKYKGTDVSEEEAKKILESVGGEEQAVKKRKAQNDAREGTKKDSQNKQQFKDRGNPW